MITFARYFKKKSNLSVTFREKQHGFLQKMNRFHHRNDEIRSCTPQKHFLLPLWTQKYTYWRLIWYLGNDFVNDLLLSYPSKKEMIIYISVYISWSILRSEPPSPNTDVWLCPPHPISRRMFRHLSRGAILVDMDQMFSKRYVSISPDQ